MAFASLTFTKVKPGIDPEEVRKVWDEGVTPILKEQKGFLGNFLLATEALDEGIAVSIWESKEDAEALQTSGIYKQLVGKFAAFTAPPIERKVYNINSELVFIK
jgi:heme-degrading monooxygenase HmoA